MVGTTKVLTSVVFCALMLSTTVSQAGALATSPDALYIGSGPNVGPDGGYWRGSVHYDNGNDLIGDIDFAVFTRADFLANYGGLGYVPSLYPSGGLVYAYQLFSTGPDATSAEIVGITNPANTIGSWDFGDVAPTTAAFVGTNARWTFSTPAIGTGQSSWGLAYSSAYNPMSGAGLVIDGGGSVVQFGLPTPSTSAIPEPASLTLMVVSGLLFLVWRRRK
jgi:PEP-CTERM motif